MRRARALPLAAVSLALAAGVLTPAEAKPGLTSRISVARSGAQGNSDTPARTVPDTTSPEISLDASVVAFSSDASNLVPGDTNGVADVFVREAKNGRITRASVSRSREQANGPSYSPALSVDGRWLAFVSAASNLVPGDTNGVADVFLLDRKKGRLRRISVSPAGAQANGPSNTPFVSLFGDWVTFDSAASNLAPGDDNGMPDAFLYVRRSRTTRRIAPPKVKHEDADTMVAWTESATISWRGEALAFARKVKRMRPEVTLPQAPPVPQPPTLPGTPDVGEVHLPSSLPDEPTMSDIFVVDRVKRRTRMVKIPRWDTYRVLAEAPRLAADGKRLTFVAASVLDARAVGHKSGAVPEGVVLPDDRLAPNPVDVTDVYLYDRFSKVVVPISRNPYGLLADGPSSHPRISSEGHMITFTSEATNLVPHDVNGVPDVFIWDSREQVVSRLSAHADGEGGGGASYSPSLSYDGRHVVFASAADDLDRGDTNTRIDVFLHDRRTYTPNTDPDLRPLGDVRTIDPGEEFALDLRVRDAERDPLRFDTIMIVPPGLCAPRAPACTSATAWPAGDLPPGMSLDPRTGAFRWTPVPSQAGPWWIVFWVGDQRGGSDIELLQVVVRSLTDIARCVSPATC